MLTAYVFRHGKSELNQKKVLQGHLDSPLLPDGIENAHSVARKLRGLTYDKAFSSDLGRAFLTTYIVMQDLGDTRPIITAPELREVSFGDLAGTKIVKAEARHPKLQRETSFKPVNGESLGEMQQRVFDYLLNLAKTQVTQTIIIGTHDCVLNALYAAYANIDLGPYNVEHYNVHDFVAKLVMENDRITSFEEYNGAAN